MINKYVDKLEELYDDAINELFDVIEDHGVESEFTNGSVIKLKDDHVMFNITEVSLGNGNYLTEVGIDTLFDQDGLAYSYYVLSPNDFFSVVDYIINKFK